MIQKLNLMILMVVILTPNLVYAATYQGSFNVDVGKSSIIIDPKVCEEDWSGSFWGDCIDSQEKFSCFEKNNCGTNYLKPALCGEVRNCTIIIPPSSSSSSGGSSGGGSSSGGSLSKSTISTGTKNLNATCVERWRCSSWSNREEECGERICEDIRQCGKENLKPNTSKKCSSIDSSGITGSVIGGFEKFSKSKVGMSILFILIISVLFALISISKKKK